MIISFFPEAEKSEHWPAIRELLAPAAKMGGIEAKEDNDLIWVALDKGKVWAAFTIRLVERVLEIRCAGGARLFDWVEPFERTMTDFGRDCSAGCLELRGRRGWGRWAERLGWRYHGQDEDDRPVFRKDL